MFIYAKKNIEWGHWVLCNWTVDNDDFADWVSFDERNSNLVFLRTCCSPYDALSDLFSGEVHMTLFGGSEMHPPGCGLWAFGALVWLLSRSVVMRAPAERPG